MKRISQEDFLIRVIRVIRVIRGRLRLSLVWLRLGCAGLFVANHLSGSIHRAQGAAPWNS